MTIISISYSLGESIDQIVGAVGGLKLILAQKELHDAFNSLKMMINVLKNFIRIIIKDNFKRPTAIFINIKIVFSAGRYNAVY